MSDIDMAPFFALREKTFAAIKFALEIDGYCKSYEGRMTLAFPNYFDNDVASVIYDMPKWEIALDCYVLGPARHYQWEGETLVECCAKASADIDEWLRESEDVQ